MNLEGSNSNNLTSMLRLLNRATRAERFSLLFSICSSLDEQNEYIKEIKQRCLSKNIVPINIELFNKLPIDNLFEEVNNYLEQNFRDGLPKKLFIQVTGIEVSILLDSDESFPKVLQTLNIGRERYRANLPYPLLIWLPEYAYVKLANVAPDFWSIREGSFTFYSEEVTDNSLNIDEIILAKKDISDWREKIDQIPVIERLIEIIEQSKDTENKIVRELPITDVKNLIDFNLKLGEAYRFIGKIEKSKGCFEKALDLNKKKLDDDDREGRALNGLGLAYTNMDELSKAIESFKNYIEISKKNGKQDALAIGYNHIAFVYYKLLDFEESLSFYKKSLEINIKIGQRQAECDVVGNLGLVYQKLAEFDEAVRYHQEALNISREIANVQSELKDLSNIGSVYHLKGNHQEAKHYYIQALRISQQIGNKLDELDQQLNLGTLCLDSDSLKESKDWYLKALKIAEEVGNEKLIAYTEEKLLELYSNDSEQQGIWIERLIVKAENCKNLNNYFNFCKMLIEICKQQDFLTKKRSWLLKAESILQKLCNQSDLEFSTITYYVLSKMFMNIYISLGCNPEVQECKINLDILKNMNKINIYLSPSQALFEKKN